MLDKITGKGKTGMRTICCVLAFISLVTLAACDTGEQNSSGPVARKPLNPRGRILTADDGSNSVSVISTATDKRTKIIATGARPHHVAASPDGKEFWVSLYGENRVQVFDAQTLSEAGSVNVGGSNDDLVMGNDGKTLYVTLNSKGLVAVVDAISRKYLKAVKVGTAPHGVMVTPDGKSLVVTNTQDNTVSLLSLQPDVAVQATIEAGPDPYEVVISENSKFAYISNFLGDTITVLDLEAHKTIKRIPTGKQPAMLSLSGNAANPQVWVANTGSTEAWLLDIGSGLPVARVPVSRGSHGIVLTPAGKVYLTSPRENAVTAIDASTKKVIASIRVGNMPNGLAYLPDVQAP